MMSAVTIASSAHLSRMLSLSLLMCIKLRKVTQPVGPGARLAHYDVLALVVVEAACAGGCILLTMASLISCHPRYPEHAGTPNTPVHMQETAASDTEPMQMSREGPDVLAMHTCRAPEQADADFGARGPHSDVWGFAATVLHLATGEQPYKNLTVVQMISAMVKSKPPSVSDTLPAWLQHLLKQCFSFNTASRPPVAQLLQVKTVAC